jgi:hypothetical protein
MEDDAAAKKAVAKMEEYVGKHAAAIHFDKPRDMHSWSTEMLTDAEA